MDKKSKKTNVSKERAISIFLVKSFRKFLDKTVKPNNNSSQYNEAQISIIMEFLYGKDTVRSPKIESQIKSIFQNISSDFIDLLCKQYDNNLPSIITDIMSELEKYLVENYSKEEIDELFLLSQSPVISKISCDILLFSTFYKYKQKMITAMEDGLMDYIDSPVMKEKFQNSVQDLLEDIENDDPDNFGENKDDSSLDPNDLF
jgi:hypothetical protein